MRLINNDPIIQLKKTFYCNRIHFSHFFEMEYMCVQTSFRVSVCTHCLGTMDAFAQLFLELLGEVQGSVRKNTENYLNPTKEVI